MHSYNQALVVDSWSASWILISIQFCSICPKLVYIYSHASKDNQTCLHIQFIFTRLQGQNSPFYEIPKCWQYLRLALESPYSTVTDLADHLSNFRNSVLYCFEVFVKVADELFIFPWNSFQDWLPYSKQLGSRSIQRKPWWMKNSTCACRPYDGGWIWSSKSAMPLAYAR